MKAGFWEILLIVILVLILFGHSKIPDMMKNLANGLNVFKKELKGTDNKVDVKSSLVSTKSPGLPKPSTAKKKSAPKKTSVVAAPVKKTGIKKSVKKQVAK